jgi:hypothetical protein
MLIDVASGKTLASWDHPVDHNGNDMEALFSLVGRRRFSRAGRIRPH